ncbi:unnamed protein product [Haemonchus placei]|uniref:Reverse transcriptase domain-containing protein n=1 Tax=Haemonchus placei TaxID=6290 RepID=A0A0N4W5K5_HAEPC|nr:unnamed protein product [Haemonchus placei]
MGVVAAPPFPTPRFHFRSEYEYAWNLNEDGKVPSSVPLARLGRCTKTKATPRLNPDTHPVFKKRSVLYTYVAAPDEEIDLLLAEQVLSPVDYSAWAAPIVVIKKTNGTLRLCAGFSTGLNDALMLHQHPLPTPDDVFAKLNGATAFTRIEFADAYLQIEVEDEAKELLTINTHRGLLRYSRLPFGVKSAPGIFQQNIDSMICGLEGCAAYLDDVSQAEISRSTSPVWKLCSRGGWISAIS